jgi:hypothetical protein
MRRLAVLLALAGALSLAVAAPASAREFGTIYAEGETFRTFGNPARVDPGTGTDPLARFTTQDSVAQFAPGQGSHGGRWAIYDATWLDPEAIQLVTDWGEIVALVEAGDLALTRVPGADFRCPILPDA